MRNTNTLTSHAVSSEFDQALRSEMRWEAPPELTDRLMALAVSPALSSPAQVSGYRAPRPRYTNVLLAITALIVGLSFAVAWQIYGLLGAQLGLADLWFQIQLVPASVLSWLYDVLPVTRYAIALLSSVRDQLHWLLIAAVLWLALDGWTPELRLRKQQA